MFTESEIDDNVDFIPRNYRTHGICINCLHFNICPVDYECKTFKRFVRWQFENLDDDNTC